MNEAQRALTYLGEALVRAIDGSAEVSEAVRWLDQLGYKVHGCQFQVLANSTSPQTAQPAPGEFETFMRSIGATDPENPR